MKSIRLTAIREGLQETDIPVAQPGPLDIVLRVGAAGICHSDAHYRKGTSPAGPLPLTPGHEVAGTVEAVGTRVDGISSGDRVCIHYLVTCGICEYCTSGNEQFCRQAEMIGKDRDGGYAEYLTIPARNAFKLPSTVSLEHAAVAMCSSSTSLHALRKARLQRGETVAVFGLGGLGMSAVQLARILGADRVFAVDLQTSKLKMAEEFGAIPIDAADENAVEAIRSETRGRGVDVAVEVIGYPTTLTQAFQALGPMGRMAVAGICREPFALDPYTDLIGREAEVIGVSDHLASEIGELLGYLGSGQLQLDPIVTRTVPLEAEAINRVLDDLEVGTSHVRAVIRSGG